MRIFPSIILLLFVSVSSLSAKALLDKLPLQQGNWAMVAVPVHNYYLLPVQQELGTFMTNDRAFLQEIQARWDFDPVYEDDCDYHYALKFYQDKQLMKTYMLNLHCGYISVDGLSYAFDPAEFQRFQSHSEEIAWSRISFGDLSVLKQAIQTLSQAPDVYWYEDVNQYKYEGFFMLNLNNLSWKTDLDSLQQAVETAIVRKTGKHDFYLQRYFHLVQGEKMSVRYLVNCNQQTGTQLSTYAVIPWRSHLQPYSETTRQDSVRVLVLGVDKRRYFQLMRN